MSDFFRWEDDTLLLQVQVQTRASKDEIVGPLGDALKIRITAPPVDGKANKHLVRFLAKTFGVSQSDIKLLSGQTSRLKRFSIHSPSRLPDAVST